MAKPPRSAALNDASAPLILPIGVRAPATMYEPAMHEGKLGVLCLASSEGLGVTDPELRAKVGDKLHLFRR